MRLEAAEHDWRQPVLVVVDSGLRTPVTAKLFKAPGPVRIATVESDNAACKQALVDAGAKVMLLPAVHGRVDLTALMRELAQHECNEVLVEAGAQLNGALLEAGLIDELIVYMAPHLLGDTARGMFAIPALADMQARRELQLTDLRRIGGNIRMIFSVEQN